MPRSLPPLTALRTFEVAARLGSFTRAARDLHVTPAAVSHQIRGLEQYLGVRLFRRTTRKLVLTEQAALAAESLREAFERMTFGVDLLRSSGDGGSLSISVTPAFATRWLLDRLPRFRRLHPRIEVQIQASSLPVDFEQQDVDVAVRIGRGGSDGVVAVELFSEWVVPLASPAFLRLHPLRKPADIAKLPLLHDDSMRRAGRPQGWHEWFRDAGVPQAELRRGMRFDDGHLALQAAATGSGVALGRLVYAAGDLASKRLRVAMSPVIKLDIEYYLLVPEARANLPAVVAFRAWMGAEAMGFRRSLEPLLVRGAGRFRKSRARPGPAQAE